MYEPNWHIEAVRAARANPNCPYCKEFYDVENYNAEKSPEDLPDEDF